MNIEKLIPSWENLVYFATRNQGPAVCFGPRKANGIVLNACEHIGRTFGEHLIPVWSGGARGCDSAFVRGCNIAGGTTLEFDAPDWEGDYTLFAQLCYARSRKALDGANALGGFAVIFLPENAEKGGSLYSYRYALKTGIPCFAFFFDQSSITRSEVKIIDG